MQENKRTEAVLGFCKIETEYHQSDKGFVESNLGLDNNLLLFSPRGKLYTFVEAYSII
jgi:hypothetical protein